MHEEIILVDKPANWTSFDVVAKIRSQKSKVAGQKVKVGHAGTLDPFATGLLIILVGSATKKQDSYMKKDKEYIATLKLGATSSTGDPEGEIVPTEKAKEVPPSREQIEQVTQIFLGDITQIPPQYSAIKINGKPAYKYARRGEKVEIKPRQVRINALTVLRYNYPELEFRVSCSSGTYIRTLASDMGEKLGRGAYLTSLRRTKIGEFDVKDAQIIT